MEYQNMKNGINTNQNQLQKTNKLLFLGFLQFKLVET